MERIIRTHVATGGGFVAGMVLLWDFRIFLGFLLDWTGTDFLRLPRESVEPPPTRLKRAWVTKLLGATFGQAKICLRSFSNSSCLVLALMIYGGHQSLFYEMNE